MSLVVGSLRRNVDPELHKTYLLSTQNLELLRQVSRGIGIIWTLYQSRGLRSQWEC